MLREIVAYFRPDGRPSLEGLRYFQEQAKLIESQAAHIEALEGKIAAIASISAPSGGTTIDTQARAAITGITNAAGS